MTLAPFRLVVFALLAGAIPCGGAGLAHAQSAPAPGTRLVDVIAELQASGRTIIYSSELVPESLRVLQAPDARAPMARLAQALEPHGLALDRGPRGSWLIVRAPAARDASAPTTPRGPTPSLPELETVIVTASRYAFARSTATSAQRIDRTQLENAPTLGDDALRTTHGLPGLTSSGLTSQVNVRGGEANETLFLLDGVRLYEPFHLKDFQSLFGAISPRIVERIDVHSGGYTAEFGDRMSGVIAMQTVDPIEQRRHEVGVSTLSTSVLSSGRFADGAGEWLTSIRRGNLDLLIDAADSDLGRPQYTDLFTELGYELDGGVALTAGMLVLDDKITLVDSGRGAATANYDDAYLWLRLEHAPSEALTASYRIVRARTDGERAGSLDDAGAVTGMLRDVRNFAADSVAADWTYRFDERRFLRFGAMVEDTRASYDYAATRVLHMPIRIVGLATPPDAVVTQLRLADRRRAVYASYRLRALPRLTTELGLRWDDQSLLDDHQLSPRASVLLDLGDRVALRASWGRFHQPQGANELQVADGLTELSPAQEAEHSVFSVEYALGDTLVLRAELYRKEFERVRPRFDNLFARISLLPELQPDRVMIDPLRAAAHGLEISVEGRQTAWQWWASATRARVEDRLADRWVSRSWEEPWSAKGGALWSGARWTVSGTLTLRSGWPVTTLVLTGGELVAGAYNTKAFETFRSLDVRANRRVTLTRGELDLFVELNNALDFENPCCLDYAVGMDSMGRPDALSLDTDRWLGVVPSFGFLWKL